jgi:hypothetical protein
MGLALILIGVVVWLLLSTLLVIGVILLFVPHTYGPADWRGRRAPP